MPLFEHGFLWADADQVRNKFCTSMLTSLLSLKNLNDLCHEYVRTGNTITGKILMSPQLAISCED
jgi:hypothetical protein